MSEKDKEIKCFEIEEITLQAETLYGLSHVCAVYLDGTRENSLLQKALECLSDEAYKHHKDCDKLMDKICNS